MFTNKKREGINRFVCDASLYVAKTPKASIKCHKPLLPIIPCGIVAYGFVGQPFSKQLYTHSVRSWCFTQSDQPRSQDLYPGLVAPPPSQGKGPGNEVAI